jgi:hypothetical protein
MRRTRRTESRAQEFAFHCQMFRNFLGGGLPESSSDGDSEGSDGAPLGVGEASFPHSEPRTSA